MRKTKSLLFLGSCLALALANNDFVSADQAEAKFSRTELLNKQVTLASPEINAKVSRVRFSRGFKTPLHTHEGPWPRYVLKGRLQVEDNGEVHVYKSGQVFWETGTEMTVENIGKGEAEIIIFEMATAKPQ
ncbi:MAG: cupin domain-containing protein [Methylomonas sp.]|jgi:quercetin dioxygenase-like cupin family protein|uniref:cupin domain-containing protein n=1 Tax=Methylomonas sp. TaxID=418 RepID=UPI0025FD17F9|nr:cupin domain-containing protein [Methylomonas sp.]MCK9609035.1 cupin domain-containing protein [Methylomonas sp.]